MGSKKRFHLSLPGSLRERPVLQELMGERAVAVNILRGRFTEESAELEVEIDGEEAEVREAVAHLEQLGVTVRSDR